MLRLPLLLLLLLATLLALPAWALDVVATSPSMGALVRAVGGPGVRVTELAGPDRDLHAMQVRPSMMQALRGADLVVAIGAELEIGWLPEAIASAGNPSLLPGQAGYFEAAAQVPLLEIGAPADRALGDVHPVGNPHVNMDPVRMAQAATALAGRMGQLDAANAAAYRANADAFATATAARVADWQARLRDAPGVVLQHRDAVYLLDRFDVPLLGTIEAIPGVPPSGGQVRSLLGKLRSQSVAVGSAAAGSVAPGAPVIIIAPYHAPRPARTLSGELGWPLHRLTLEPPTGSDGVGYLRHIDGWVGTIAGGR